MGATYKGGRSQLDEKGTDGSQATCLDVKHGQAASRESVCSELFPPDDV